MASPVFSVLRRPRSSGRPNNFNSNRQRERERERENKVIKSPRMRVYLRRRRVTRVFTPNVVSPNLTRARYSPVIDAHVAASLILITHIL